MRRQRLSGDAALRKKIIKTREKVQRKARERRGREKRRKKRPSNKHTVIQDASNTNDVARFYQIKQSIANAVTQRGSPAKPQINRNGTAQQPRQNIAHLNTPLPSFNNGFSPDIFSPPMAPPMPSPLALNFKPSPFYRIEGPVGEVRICESKQCWSVVAQWPRTLVE